MEISIIYKGLTILADTDIENTHIPGSFRVKSRGDMRRILEILRKKAPEWHAVNMLSVEGMIHEWRAHNLLHALGVMRERTADVDLDFEPWWRRALYRILSALYTRR